MVLSCPECGLPAPSAESLPPGATLTCKVCGCAASAEAFREAVPLEQRAARVATPPLGLSLVEGQDGFALILSTSSWAALLVWPLLVVWSMRTLSMIHRLVSENGLYSLPVFLFGLLVAIGVAVLMPLAFMATFGRIELTLSREGLLRLRKGGLGIYVTRTASWSDLVSAESREIVSFSSKRAYLSHACLIRLGQGREWRFETDGSREQADWIARYLSERIHLRLT